MLNVPIDISLVLAIVGLALAVLAHTEGRRRLAVAEGKHLQQVETIERRLTACEAENKALKEAHGDTAADTREIKTDLVWIKKTLTEIKERLPS